MSDIYALAADTAAHLNAAGYDATAREAPDNRDGYVIHIAASNGLALPFRITVRLGYGSERNRVTFKAWVTRPEGLHYSDVPTLGETTTARDATGKRAASQCITRILEPAKPLLQALQARIDDMHAADVACDAIERRLASLGMLQVKSMHAPATGRTSVRAYKSVRLPNGDSLMVTADCHANGRVTVDRLYIPAGVDGIKWLADLCDAAAKGSN